MTAPRINPEISVILSVPQQARDNAHLQYQTSVGTALSALGSGLNILLQQDQNIPSDVKESLLKPFGDAGRILANVFASISSNRRKMILPLLAKNIKEIAETTVPTELLFGDELGDKIKSAKLAETTGKSIKATYTASHKSPYPKTGGGAMKRPHSQYIPENRSPIQRVEPRIKLSPKEITLLKAEVLRLQFIGAIKKVNTAPSQYLSSYFLADKSDGGKRFILNLKLLNKFLDPPHFKMEDFRTVLMTETGIKPFLCETFDKSLIRGNWEKWLRSLELYLASEDITSVEKKRNKLLHLGGSHLQEVACSIPGAIESYNKEENNDVFKTLVNKLTDFFSPKQNSTFERHIFRSIRNEDGEDSAAENQTSSKTMFVW
nr:unnamed protein product [Callosobruchus chinensis]